MTGTAFAKRVEGILSRAGTRFGAGELTGTLIRQYRTGPSYEPVIEERTIGSFVCIWGEFTVEERAAGLVLDGDHRLEVGATTLDVVPQAGDKVTVQGATFQVKSVEIIRPGGVALLYRLKVRA